MTRVTKIEQHGLESEANELLDLGYSRHKVAKVLSEKHDDINLSDMAVQRYADKRNDNQLVDLRKSGEIESVSEYLIEQLLKETNAMFDEINDIKDMAKELYDNPDARVSDKINILKQLINTINQQLKTWESRVNIGTRQIQRANTDGEKQAKTMNVLVIELADYLCDNCKAKLLDMLQKM